MREDEADRLALVESIRHWKNDYKQLMLYGGRETVFSGVFCMDDCGLCKRHQRGYRRYESDDTCGRCPLADPVRDRFGEVCDMDGCGHESQYNKAYDACCMNGDKKAFMRARKNMLRRMRRALRVAETKLLAEMPEES